MDMNEQTVLFEYVNHRGYTATRTVTPLTFYFGTRTWHPTRQHLFDGFDHDKGERRTFAMTNVRNWRPAATSPPAPSSADSSQTLLPPTHC